MGEALGIEVSNFKGCDCLIGQLLGPSGQPTRLHRFMTRERAEYVFERALRCERFRRHTLCCYYLNDGWLNFRLDFDAQDRLRRLYVQHRCLEGRGRELPLARPLSAAKRKDCVLDDTPSAALQS